MGNLSTQHVRLNLFNHVLALFCAKFSCKLAIRYPIFRWELCRGSLWKSVKRTQDVCNSKESHDWLVIGKSPKWDTCEARRGSWRVTTTGALQDKTSSPARQLARNSFQSRGWLARMPCLVETWLFALLIHPTINTLLEICIYASES